MSLSWLYFMHFACDYGLVGCALWGSGSTIDYLYLVGVCASILQCFRLPVALFPSLCLCLGLNIFPMGYRAHFFIAVYKLRWSHRLRCLSLCAFLPFAVKVVCPPFHVLSVCVWVLGRHACLLPFTAVLRVDKEALSTSVLHVTIVLLSLDFYTYVVQSYIVLWWLRCGVPLRFAVFCWFIICSVISHH